MDWRLKVSNGSDTRYFNSKQIISEYIDGKDNPNYNNRAASRRKEKGGFDGSEKTQTASLES